MPDHTKRTATLKDLLGRLDRLAEELSKGQAQNVVGRLDEMANLLEACVFGLDEIDPTLPKPKTPRARKAKPRKTAWEVILKGSRIR